MLGLACISLGRAGGVYLFYFNFIYFLISFFFIELSYRGWHASRSKGQEVCTCFLFISFYSALLYVYVISVVEFESYCDLWHRLLVSSCNLVGTAHECQDRYNMLLTK
jgi:hypothetical protein